MNRVMFRVGVEDGAVGFIKTVVLSLSRVT